MAKVRDILEIKGGSVWSIGPGDSVYNAVKMMADKGVGALMVMEGESVVGVLSERDYARKVILEGRSSKTTEVRKIMSANVIYAHLDQDIEECMVTMTEKRVRHLPVVDGGKIIGVISIGDLVKSIISEQKFVIEQLEQYIRG